MTNEPQDPSAVTSSAEQVDSSSKPLEVEVTDNVAPSSGSDTGTPPCGDNESVAASVSEGASPAEDVISGGGESVVAESSTTESPATETPSIETPAAEAVAPTGSTSTASTSSAPESGAEDGDAGKAKIAIGSQRGDTGAVVPKSVERAAAEGGKSSGGAAKKPAGPVPVPSKRGSSESEEQELASILGGSSIDALVEQSADGQDGELEIDSRVKATVQRLHQDNVFFQLKGRFEGVASVRQFKKPPEQGDMVEVVVKKFMPDDGLYEVAVPGAAAAVADWSDVEPGTVVDVKITGSNTGGLECSVNNIRGFIPASQIDLHRVENFGDYVNQKMTCVVTEANKKRKNLVLSRRQLLESQLAEERKEKLAKIQVGDEVEGKVTRLTDFGAFVDIGGGIEGLVHISKISWDRIDHPKDVLTNGQAIKVRIEKVNAETNKISLSYRDTIEHPWHGIESKYTVGSTVKGTVSRLAQFGAFVKLEPGVEGLVHISELAYHRVVAVKNIVKEGDEIEVKVLSIEPDKQKMGLSLKATLPEPEKPNKPNEEEVAAEHHRPLAIPKREGPLKGGKDKSSGGDRFGLNW